VPTDNTKNPKKSRLLQYLSYEREGERERERGYV
jgi:hypothetical protein